jgi:short-subunit dehydrogenase
MSLSHEYGPWAVIAGGSEGVGAEFALQLADQGISSLLIARKPEPLEETAAAVRSRGVEARTLAVDLTAPTAVSTIVEAAGDIEVGLFIYNAGANSYGHHFVGGDWSKYNALIDLNITTPLKLVQSFGAPMVERSRGGILLTGSVSGYLGAENLGVYGGVKAFGQIFAEGLWLELREHGVDVLELVLGVTRTPAMARAGLNFDAPGLQVSEPAEVAREGLAHLKDGPVWLMPKCRDQVEHQSGTNRRELVLEQHEMMKSLMGSR